MAYEHDYRRTSNPTDYGNVGDTRMSSRAILIALGIIALIVVALIAFAPADTSGLRDVTGSTTPATPPATVPAEPVPSTPLNNTAPAQ